MAYCSLVVNAGSFNDPPHRQGLAHFLEHMIFMGSYKYRGEAEYGDHVAASGGYCNAYTEPEISNFQMSVKYSGLQRALDMQANNFAAPLLLKEAMAREINAIDDEFKGNQSDESVRLLQILAENTESPNHLFSTFPWGNLKSLSDEDDDALWNDVKRFYDDHYSADRIKLVV